MAGTSAEKVAALVGSINERASTPLSARRQGWRIPFVSSVSESNTFATPNHTPSNFDELVARLTSLESSFASLSRSQLIEHNSRSELARKDSDTARRLSTLESDFESEIRKISKAHEALKKDYQKESGILGEGQKGTRMQIDYLSDRVKGLLSERKQDSLEVAKFKIDAIGLNKDLKELNKKISEIQKEVHGNSDQKSIEDTVNSAVEHVLPKRLAVSIDANTNQVKIDPIFWQHLQSTFAPFSANANRSSSGTSSWPDFLAFNQHNLQGLIADDISTRLGSGAVLSKQSFFELLDEQLQSLKNEVSHSTSESLSKLSQEFSGKLSKASVLSASAKASSIRLSGGEDLNALVSTLIDTALDKYSKDILAKPDFALYSAGGRIIPSLTTPTYEIRSNTYIGTLLGRFFDTAIIRGKPPVTALHPDISVGQCWPFAGQSGQVGVLLSRKIFPTDITIEHASKDVALDFSSAPKRFEAWGMIEDKQSLEKLQAAAVEEQSIHVNHVLLVSGEYDVNASSHVQTFNVSQSVRDLEIPINVVLFRILDNYGNEALSCLYRLRVGGLLVDDDQESV